MRIPYGFDLVNNGVLEVKESEAINIRMIFDYYLAGASLGKVMDMLYAKQLLSPTGKEKWTRAAIAKAFAESEFEQYRVMQARLYQSDFDKLVAAAQKDEEV